MANSVKDINLQKYINNIVLNEKTNEILFNLLGRFENRIIYFEQYRYSRYDVAINNSCSQTDYKDTHITAEQFFSDFPLIVFKDDYRNKRLDTFYQILKTFARFQTLKMFLNLSEQNNKLLLII